MKYTDETTIEDIAEYALEHWDAFMQDVRGQKLKKWLLTEMHEDGLAQLMEEQLHSDWTMLYPCLSATRIFEILQKVENKTTTSFLKSFISKHKAEIEKEKQKFSRLNNNVVGTQNGKPIIGFLLAFEDHEPSGVYFLYEGTNVFGSGSGDNERNFQRITTSEPLLSLKHFEVVADYSGDLSFHLINGNNFIYESNRNFNEGRIDFGDSIVLGGLKLTFLQNINIQ